MRRRFAPALAIFTLWLVAHAAAAVEVEGVEFPSQIEAPGGALLLNGAGVRSLYFLDIYAAGLYLPARTTKASEIITGAVPQRMVLQLLREVSAERFSGAFEDGLRANHSEAQMQQLAPRIQQLKDIMNQLGVAKQGTRVEMTRIPGVGTVIAIDGGARGKPIPGDDFFQALLKNWIGEHPVSADLKRALLAAHD